MKYLILFVIFIAVIITEQLPAVHYMCNGYNILYGTPIPKSTEDLIGFRTNVFNCVYNSTVSGPKSNYTTPYGSATVYTNNFINQNFAKSFTTVEEFSNLYRQSWDIKSNHAGEYTKQVSHIIRTIYGEELVEIVNFIQVVDYVSIFSHTIEPSKEFANIIDNLSDSSFVSWGIIFEYFGTHVLSGIELGGVISGTYTVPLSDFKKFGIENSEKYSRISFNKKIDVKNGPYSEKLYDEFQKISQFSGIEHFGGNINDNNYKSWINSIKDMLVPVAYKLLPIDQYIGYWWPEKIDIVKKALLVYINTQPINCPNNCSKHGTCEPLNYFNNGLCKCDKGWSSYDCSKRM